MLKRENMCYTQYTIASTPVVRNFFPGHSGAFLYYGTTQTVQNIILIMNYFLIGP